MNVQKIIIDTDPGIDDAMAIFFAGLSNKLDLVALTSVFGNVTLDNATRNAMVLAEILEQNIPVSRGFPKPLVQTPTPVSDTYMVMKALEISQPEHQTQKKLISLHINILVN